MGRPSVLGIILAGGRGERLYPLTRDRSKPAVPFGGKYRIIDFILSSLLNSGIDAIYVLVQYKSQSLIEHLRAAWRLGGRLKGSFITVVPPQFRQGERWYRGTADAVYQNLNLIRDFRPDLVAIFGADHIYRIDTTQMVDFHLRREADVTVATLPVPLAQATRFGIVKVGADERVVGFAEKPKRPEPMPQDPQMAYASMGSYLFNREILKDALNRDARRDTEHDFGKSVLPDLYPDASVYAYDFFKNEIPGLKPYEERGYWRDIGDIEAYWKAHMALLGPTPVFDLENRVWPILAEAYDGPPCRIFGGKISNSMIGEGGTVRGAKITRSILGKAVQIERGAQIEDAILFDHVEVGAGARLRKVIIDRFNTIKPGEEIGYDLEKDKANFTVGPSGVVVLPRGETRFFYKG